MKPTSMSSKQRMFDLVQDLVARSRISTRANEQGEFDHLLVVMPPLQFAEIYSPQVYAVLFWAGTWLSFVRTGVDELNITCRNSGRMLRVAFEPGAAGFGTVVSFFSGTRRMGRFRLRKYSREALCDTPYGRQLVAKMTVRVLNKLLDKSFSEMLRDAKFPAIQIVAQRSGTTQDLLFEKSTLQ